MIKIKAIALKKEILSQALVFSALMAVAMLAPFLKNQFATGSIVNCALFVSVVVLGMRGAVLIALLPSIFSLLTGLLPLPLAPMVPFIIMANVLLVVVFNHFKEKKLFSGIMAASFLKFAFLWAASSFVTKTLLKIDVAEPVANMMAWPQLITALVGGIAAFFLLERVQKRALE
jgi:hypothetical protein